jgi:hypothetical protein
VEADATDFELRTIANRSKGHANPDSNLVAWHRFASYVAGNGTISAIKAQRPGLDSPCLLLWFRLSQPSWRCWAVSNTHVSFTP